MASVGGVTSGNANSIYGNRNVLSGLASGMDTESMIQNAISGHRLKITGLQKKQTSVQWQQNAFRSITDKLVQFSRKYTSYTSATNLTSPSFFAKAVLTETKGDNKDYISATGKTSSDVTVNGVQQIASKSQYTAKQGGVLGTNSNTITASEGVDLNAETSNSPLTGYMTFTYGNTKVELDITQETIDAARKALQDGGQLSSTDTDEAKANNEKLVFAKAVQTTLQNTKATGLGDGSNMASHYIDAKLDGNKLIFSDKVSTNAVYVSGMNTGAKNAFDITEFPTGSKEDRENNREPITSLDLDKLTLDETTKKSTVFADLEGKKMNFSVDGKTKTITLPSKEELDAFVASNSNLNGKNLDEQYTAYVQDKLNSAFGNGKITVKDEDSADNTLKLSFTVQNGSSLIMSSASNKDLKLPVNASTSLDTRSTLGNLLGEDNLPYDTGKAKGNGTPEPKYYVDKDGKVVDKNGNLLDANGKTINDTSKPMYGEGGQGVTPRIKSMVDTSGKQYDVKTYTKDSKTYDKNGYELDADGKKVSPEVKVDLDSSYTPESYEKDGVSYDKNGNLQSRSPATLSDSVKTYEKNGTTYDKDGYELNADGTKKDPENKVSIDDTYNVKTYEKDGVIYDANGTPTKDSKGDAVQTNVSFDNSKTKYVDSKGNAVNADNQRVDGSGNKMYEAQKGNGTGDELKGTYWVDDKGNRIDENKNYIDHNGQPKTVDGKTSFAGEKQKYLFDADGKRVDENGFLAGEDGIAKTGEKQVLMGNGDPIKQDDGSYKDKDGNKVNENGERLGQDGKVLHSMKLVINGKEVGTYHRDTALETIMQDINADDDLNMSVGYSKMTNQFTFTADETGAGHEFKYENDGLMSAIFGNYEDTNFKAGEDARINMTVNGENMTITRSENTIDVDGMKLTLKDKFNADIFQNDGTVDNSKLTALTPNEKITFESGADSDKIVEAIKTMVEDFNTMATETRKAYNTVPNKNGKGNRYEPLSEDDKTSMSEDAIKNYEEKAKVGLLFGDSDLSSMYNQLISSIAPGGSDGAALRNIGLTTEYSEGITTLKLDETKLREALRNNPDSVSDIFTKSKAAGSATDGIMARLDKTLDTFASTEGANKGILIQKAGSQYSALSLLDNQLYDQLKDYDTQITKWQDKLSDKVDYYTRQFTRLEQLINNANSQSNALMGMMGY